MLGYRAYQGYRAVRAAQAVTAAAEAALAADRARKAMQLAQAAAMAQQLAQTKARDEPCGDCEDAKTDEDETPYAGETPKDKPEDFKSAKGRRGSIKKSDGSYWEKDFSQHGGSEWKRWPSLRDFEKGKGRESVRPDGSVR
ncbi:hypothetical protein [Agrobacterium vaccinii]|uniref:hypothetical protein n=1 Tax=Agrobacterium vaccinii TaxID=2735528 RepID=UPI001E459BC2|nr:hypothetical protein [Agrobacterium vaccinii]UHS59562.1 hypothetical protein HRS00_22400 [Agrobacterium vaccinii]